MGHHRAGRATPKQDGQSHGLINVRTTLTPFCSQVSLHYAVPKNFFSCAVPENSLAALSTHITPSGRSLRPHRQRSAVACGASRLLPPVRASLAYLQLTFRDPIRHLRLHSGERTRIRRRRRRPHAGRVLLVQDRDRGDGHLVDGAQLEVAERGRRVSAPALDAPEQVLRVYLFSFVFSF